MGNPEDSVQTAVSPFLAAFLLAIGILCFLCGVFGKKFTTDDGKWTPIPRAYGALLFIAISVPFFLIGASILYEWFRS